MEAVIGGIVVAGVIIYAFPVQINPSLQENIPNNTAKKSETQDSYQENEEKNMMQQLEQEKKQWEAGREERIAKRNKLKEAGVNLEEVATLLREVDAHNKTGVANGVKLLFVLLVFLIILFVFYLGKLILLKHGLSLFS